MLIGVGAVPRTELAEAAGLPVRNGVLVNEQLEAVGAAGVYAAGDVAAAWHPRYQTYLRVEHWANALNQGPAAARNMLGVPTPYARLPYFYSDQYDLGMEYSGMAAELGPGGGPRRPGRPGVHRLLAQGPAGRRRHERQRLGRHRVYPGPDPRAGGRSTRRGSLTPTSPWTR